MIIEAVVAGLLIIGAAFTLIGSFGLARLPDFYTRLHGPTKATTLGAGAVILASMLYFSTLQNVPNFHELLIVLFLFLTAPVSAHLMARAALVRRVDSVTGGSDTADGHRRPDDEPGANEPAKVDVDPATDTTDPAAPSHA